MCCWGLLPCSTVSDEDFCVVHSTEGQTHQIEKWIGLCIGVPLIAFTRTEEYAWINDMAQVMTSVYIEDDARKLMLENCGSSVNGLDSWYWTGYCFPDVWQAWFCFLMCMFCADMFWSNSIQDAESCITCWLIFRQMILYLSTTHVLGANDVSGVEVITACLCHSWPRWWTNTLWVTLVRVAFVLVWLEMTLLLPLKYFKLRVFEIYWWKDHRWDWVQVQYLQEFGSVVNSGEVAAMWWSTSSFM